MFASLILVLSRCAS